LSSGDERQVVSYRVLIVDDHVMIATALQVSFRSLGWQVEVTNGASATDVIDAVTAFKPNCVLLDLNLGWGVKAGLDLIEPITHQGAVVVMLTGETDRHVLARCLQAGALGWIGKHSPLEEVICGVTDALNGRALLPASTRETLFVELRAQSARSSYALSRFARLTPRERVVLSALMEGKNADEIATELFVSLATIRSQIRSVLQKLNVHSQLAAVTLANAAGWQP
jgi:two-component system, NarL family, nitrate/nitrite response regulator NarL